MPTDKKLKSLVLNVMTEEQYNSATKNEDELYLTPDEGGGNIVYKAQSSRVTLQARQYEPGETVFVSNERLTNMTGYWYKIKSGLSTFTHLNIDGVLFVIVSTATGVVSTTPEGATQIYTELLCINGGTINTEKSYTIELIYATIE